VKKLNLTGPDIITKQFFLGNHSDNAYAVVALFDSPLSSFFAFVVEQLGIGLRLSLV
jgi:hypothetical protein